MNTTTTDSDRETQVRDLARLQALRLRPADPRPLDAAKAKTAAAWAAYEEVMREERAMLAVRRGERLTLEKQIGELETALRASADPRIGPMRETADELWDSARNRLRPPYANEVRDRLRAISRELEAMELVAQPDEATLQALAVEVRDFIGIVGSPRRLHFGWDR